MSRTYHHRDQKNRHNGEDLWSKRLSGMLSYCTYNKWRTRKVERANERKEILKNIEESD